MTEEIQALSGAKQRFVTLRVWREEEFQYADYVIWLTPRGRAPIANERVASWSNPPLVYVSAVREN